MLPSNTSTPTDNLLFPSWLGYGVRYCTLPGFSQNGADLWQVELVRFTRTISRKPGASGLV